MAKYVFFDKEIETIHFHAMQQRIVEIVMRKLALEMGLRYSELEEPYIQIHSNVCGTKSHIQFEYEYGNDLLMQITDNIVEFDSVECFSHEQIHRDLYQNFQNKLESKLKDLDFTIGIRIPIADRLEF
jgi:hypothetical protein